MNVFLVTKWRDVRIMLFQMWFQWERERESELARWNQKWKTFFRFSTSSQTFSRTDRYTDTHSSFMIYESMWYMYLCKYPKNPKTFWILFSKMFHCDRILVCGFISFPFKIHWKQKLQNVLHLKQTLRQRRSFLFSFFFLFLFLFRCNNNNVPSEVTGREMVANGCCKTYEMYRFTDFWNAGMMPVVAAIYSFHSIK